MKKKTTAPKRSPKISHINKPDGMTLEEWQVLLRRQTAQTEPLGVQCVDEKLSPGEYWVNNAEKSNRYKVVYRGAASEWNYCSCMDFKTSRLGTCKHIEAVRLWLDGSTRRRIYRTLPPYSSVYLSYRGERQVKIRIGSDNKAEYEQLAAQYFDADGVLREDKYQDIGKFLSAAHHISPSFRCYNDAIDFLVEKRERQRRTEMVARYTDHDLDALLKATLFPYQKEGIRFAAKAGRAIIADEMGLGKTIQAIGTAELLRKEGLVGSVLIVCPTSLKYQWKSELRKFTEADVTVIEGSPSSARSSISVRSPTRS